MLNNFLSCDEYYCLKSWLKQGHVKKKFPHQDLFDLVTSWIASPFPKIIYFASKVTLQIEARSRYHKSQQTLL